LAYNSVLEECVWSTPSVWGMYWRIIAVKASV
jgi:hypothetical protein